MADYVLVVMQGGCVSGAIGDADYDTFDWDDFNDDPITYWEERCGEDMQKYIEARDPAMFTEIQSTIADAKRDEAERIAAIPPFNDVPDFTGTLIPDLTAIVEKCEGKS